MLRQQLTPRLHVLPSLRLNCLSVKVIAVDGIQRGDGSGKLVAACVSNLQSLEQRRELTANSDSLGETLELALDGLQLRSKPVNLARDRARAHCLEHALE